MRKQSPNLVRLSEICRYDLNGDGSHPDIPVVIKIDLLGKPLKPFNGGLLYLNDKISTCLFGSLRDRHSIMNATQEIVQQNYGS